jgi:hypothetical protein
MSQSGKPGELRISEPDAEWVPLSRAPFVFGSGAHDDSEGNLGHLDEPELRAFENRLLLAGATSAVVVRTEGKVFLSGDGWNFYDHPLRFEAPLFIKTADAESLRTALNEIWQEMVGELNNALRFGFCTVFAKIGTPRSTFFEIIPTNGMVYFAVENWCDDMGRYGQDPAYFVHVGRRDDDGANQTAYLDHSSPRLADAMELIGRLYGRNLPPRRETSQTAFYQAVRAYAEKNGPPAAPSRDTVLRARTLLSGEKV